MTELVLVRAADETVLAQKISNLIGFLDRVPEASLADVAYTCSLDEGDCVLAIIAEDVTALRNRLVSALSRFESPTMRRIRDKSGTYYFRERLLGEGKGKLAFVYPGVMSFYPDMLRDLTIEYSECRGAFDELEEALAGDETFTPSSFVFPPAAYYRHDADIFRSGAYAQALVSTYAACAALTRLLRRCGMTSDGVVGCAGGDLAAMVAAGCMGESPSRPDRVKILSDIYAIVNKAVNHGGFDKVAMISVLMRHPGEVDEMLREMPSDKVVLSVNFSSRQKTFAVALDYEESFLQACAAAGVRAMKIALDRPFNTDLCASLVPAVRKFASTWLKSVSACDVYSCARAERLPEKIKVLREDTAERWARPILFEETIRQMHAEGYRVFLEVGPRGLMTAAIEDTLKDVPHAAIALDSIHRRGILQVQHAIGQLVSLGAKVDVSKLFDKRVVNRIDFSSAISLTVRRDSEMRLSRSFPRLTLASPDSELTGRAFMDEPRGRGAKVAARAAAIAQKARRQRQFDFGAMSPLISDADTIESSPGVLLEIAKTFKLSEMPFLGDFALGTSQMSYSDSSLKGLTLLSLPVAAEIAAEVAELVMPNRRLLRIEDLHSRRMAVFEKGELRLFVRAERVGASQPHESAIRIQVRDDRPESAYTWPVLDTTVILGETSPAPVPVAVEPLAKPRSVHWSDRDIYPMRVCCGKRLRGVRFVEAWSESGLDYEVTVPSLAGNVTFTRFPMWVVNPLLLEIVASGFAVWRSHERFTGAFSFPFRLRRLTLSGITPKEGERLRCYMRLTGVTPKSHLCDISVTDGNGMEIASLSGWEELTERVPRGYRDLILQPASTFLTTPLEPELLGSPSTDISSAMVVDVPYNVFERNEELWLKTLSHVILDATERRVFAEMTGSVSRRTEWLFGRVAAKEAVRRFLVNFYQARWSDADIKIWADGSGKPHALGAWNDFLTTKLDIAIAHTAQFVVALAAANARVGVDVESLSRDLSDEFAAGVFLPDELELAAQGANAAQAIIKFWCAKEAVSKALGTGIRYSPKEMNVVSYLPDAGTLAIRLSGAWVEAFKVFKGRDIPVTVKSVRDHALASCFIPAALFADES